MEHHSNYISMSLELNLFFARIMKEHAFFIEAAFTPANANLAKEADELKQSFEQLLGQAIRLSNGVISRRVLRSGELTTEFTLNAERQTQRFTGIAIDSDLTIREQRLRCGEDGRATPSLRRQVDQLNDTALRLVERLIELKERVLNHVLCCKIFTMNYPLLLEHIIREAKLYRIYLQSLKNGKWLSCQTMAEIEQFWNQIMMEHALFIRGLLDPCEEDLVEASDTFAKEYAALLESCRQRQDSTLGSTKAALEETVRFRDFKAAGTKGIQDCRIRSIILPLLADHVLREANHYIALLR